VPKYTGKQITGDIIVKYNKANEITTTYTNIHSYTVSVTS